LGHYWTNGWASSKKEVGNVDFIFIISLGYGIAVLIDQLKIGNGMVFTLVLYATIYQQAIYLSGLVNR
jgi:hypothetical protein